MIKRTLPDGESESYVYDQFGNEVSHTDFDGNNSAYTYYTTYGNGAYAQQLQKVVYSPATSNQQLALIQA
jgi:YD repeat-containing protein